VLKTQLEGALRLESYRVSREEALKEIGPAAIDLGIDIAVRPKSPLPELFAKNAHGTRQVQYRVWLRDSSAADVFRGGATQQVEKLDDNSARIVVRAVRPGEPIQGAASRDDPPTDADRAPSIFIQSDDELVRLRARRAVGREKDPWKLGTALEQYVHQYIKKKDFTRAFASAAEVARAPEGDCTEHAVLLCALLRANGIPARAVIGLIYMQDRQAFGYHMWTEAYIDGMWAPLDAMLGRGGIGAAHLKIDHTSLGGPSDYASFLPVLRIAGQLAIEVEAAQ
jgi:transglutaminase-like putative cysteine protease